MKLVRFVDENGESVIDLHPLLTVVSGLPEHARTQLRQTLSALPLGGPPHGSGSLEVHGVFLDLDPETLAMLELDHDIDVVLRRSDLPGGADDEVVEQSTDHGVAEDTAELLADTNPDTEHLRQSLADAEAERARAGSELAHIRTEQEHLATQRVDADAALEGARGGLDSFAVAGLSVARDELNHLEHDRGAGAPPETDSRRAELEERLTHLIERSDTLRRQLKHLRGIDPEPVRQAYSELQRSNRGGQIDVEEAEALAAELEDASREREAVSAQQASVAGVIADHERSRDKAKQAYHAAEQSLRAPDLDQKAVDALEGVHDQIFELRGRSSKFGASKHRRKLEALEHQEAKYLDELGFETWSSYVMGVSSGAVADDRQRDFQAAKAALQLAEDELARVAASTATPSSRTAEAEERWNDLISSATRLVGRDPGDDPVGTVRGHIEQAGGPGGSMGVEDAASALRHALEGAGTELPAHVSSPAELERIGGGWIEAMAALPRKIEEAAEERESIEAEIAEKGTELEWLEGGAASDPSEGDPPDVVAARQRVAEATERVRRHDEASAQVASIESRLREITEDERALEERIERSREVLGEVEHIRDRARQELVNAQADRSSQFDATGHGSPDSSDSPREVFGTVPGQRGGPAVDSEAIEWYVLARLAQQRSVSYVGSMPLLIDDAFNGFSVGEIEPVLDRLTRMSDVIQIVFVTDDAMVIDWARRLGPRAAAVLEFAKTPA